MGLGEDMEYEFRAQDKKIANLQERIEKLETEKDPPTFKIGDRVRIPFETNLPCSGYTGMISHVDNTGMSPMATLVEVRDEHAVRQPDEDGDCHFRFDLLEHDGDFHLILGYDNSHVGSSPAQSDVPGADPESEETSEYVDSSGEEELSSLKKLHIVHVLVKSLLPHFEPGSKEYNTQIQAKGILWEVIGELHGKEPED